MKLENKVSFFLKIPAGCSGFAYGDLSDIVLTSMEARVTLMITGDPLDPITLDDPLNNTLQYD